MYSEYSRKLESTFIDYLWCYYTLYSINLTFKSFYRVILNERRIITGRKKSTFTFLIDKEVPLNWSILKFSFSQDWSCVMKGTTTIQSGHPEIKMWVDNIFLGNLKIKKKKRSRGLQLDFKIKLLQPTAYLTLWLVNGHTFEGP